MHCCSVRLFSNPDLQHTSRSWHLFVRLSVYFLTNIYLHKYGLFFILLDNGNDLNFQNIVNVVGWWLHLIFWCLHLIFWWLHLIFPKLQSCCQKLPLYKNSYSQIHHQGISSCKLLLLLLLLLLRGWCSWYFFSPSPKSPVGTSWTRYWAVKHGKVSSSYSLLSIFLKK